MHMRRETGRKEDEFRIIIKKPIKISNQESESEIQISNSNQVSESEIPIKNPNQGSESEIQIENPNQGMRLTDPL